MLTLLGHPRQVTWDFPFTQDPDQKERLTPCFCDDSAGLGNSYEESIEVDIYNPITGILLSNTNNTILNTRQEGGPLGDQLLHYIHTSSG